MTCLSASHRLRPALYFRLALHVAALACALPGPLLALDVQKISQQRGLVDQMSLATCMVMADLEPKTNAALSLQAADMFDALQSGPPDPSWLTFGPAVRQIASGDFHAIAVRQFLEDSAGLSAHLEDSLAAALRAGPRPTALVIAHFNRLAVLSQGIGRDLCLLSLDVGPQLAATRLAQAQDLFESVLTDLEEGNEAAGIRAPTGARMEDALWMLRGDWDALAERLRGVDAGLDGGLGAEDLVRLTETVGQIYTTTNDTLALYVATFARGL